MAPLFYFSMSTTHFSDKVLLPFQDNNALQMKKVRKEISHVFFPLNLMESYTMAVPMRKTQMDNIGAALKWMTIYNMLGGKDYGEFVASRVHNLKQLQVR